MKRLTFLILLLLVVLTGAIFYWYREELEPLFLHPESEKPKTPSITLAISPYQDIATIVTLHSLGLEKKYGLDVKLVTMAWEDILPALASNGTTVDMGFASFVEFLTKEQDLNRGADDPLVYVHPAYVFHGGSFISFNPEVAGLSKDSLSDKQQIEKFLSYKIGAQKSSLWEMMIYATARKGQVDIKSVKLFDSPLNDSLLAAEKGSLDIASAGLTQMTEAKKRGGRVVLQMEDLGFADITGFVCRKSTLESRRKDVEAVIKMWFDTVAYVMSDLDKNSSIPLDYLAKSSSTQYTLEQYKLALSQEYFPRSILESRQELQTRSGKFSHEKIAEDVVNYMQLSKGVVTPPAVPQFIEIQ
ncbi:ABC-type proline/glycine betaine transport systems, periplasmic component [Methyloglobulus morosus KoM1]|uniref:ABC-type proline/glycine betaine transport systems, periplasmic component n=1 Tax=Methyloglobulus morosus KoM1 TaxID=1116472 RepID=V5DXL0_9GAMM|nr:transporter substrate-binding domain-containing protein [Methyloglobulus morosus]ESS72051.1 ABC-type proline/glycine betaine transport systems, periplasmic component [Methyloglobulus morosus KoM1]